MFQRFDLNLLATVGFAGTETPYMICAEDENSAAIIPAVVRSKDGSIALIGEELFDYRSFLSAGDNCALQAALAKLAELQRPLEIVAMREREAASLPPWFNALPFCGAPSIERAAITAEAFAVSHVRLARNLRRLERLGYRVRRYRGDYPGLVRFIYEKKAAQDPNSLFRDPLRVDFMVSAAGELPDVFEIFTLEDEASIGAAVVTLRDHCCRRFYTGWFAPDLEKHSPALSLIYEVTRRSLAEDMDCDYMTGEQEYKRRLATTAVQLYRVHATADDLRSVGLDAAVPRVA